MRLLWLALTLFWATGCAVNVAEMRSARVLRGGEVTLTQGNTVVIPTSSVEQAIETGKTLVEKEDNRYSETEARQLVGTAAAIALASPGYGTFVDGAIGLGRGFELSGRLGNGIYAVGLRKALIADHPWHLTLGIRAAYNGGGTWIPYASWLETAVDPGSVWRFDGSAWLTVGREYGEWGRWWAGARAMVSPYSMEVDASQLGLGSDRTTGTLVYGGGFVGAAVGYRVFFVLAEVQVLKVGGEAELFGETHSLDGWLVAPSWGFQFQF